MRGYRKPPTQRTAGAASFCWVLVLVANLFWPMAGAGQTDYFNTDDGRPLRVQDAYPVERYAFELQAAPVTLERRSGGEYGWRFEPGLAYGLARGTEIEGSAHVRVDEGEDGTTLALGGIELAALHNLNLETRSLPAFAVGLSTVLPVGSAAPRRVNPEVTAIATRTFRLARVHVNGGYGFGRGDGSEKAAHRSRWSGGIALDRAFPLSGLLLMADVLADRPLESGASVEWSAEAGARYQLNPMVVVDLGVNRRLTGPRPAWALTLGAARAFGIRWLASPRRPSR